MDDRLPVTYAQALDVKTKYAAALMQHAHVVGVGVGVRQKAGEITDQIVVVVMVDRKIPLDQLAPHDRLPDQLEGVPVDVQEVGRFEAL